MTNLMTKAGAGVITLGDSNTLAQGATDEAHGYAARLAAYVGGSLANLAVGSEGTTTAARMALRVSGDRPSLMTCFAGLNDARRVGLGAREKIKGNIRSVISAAFTARSAPASNLRRSGVWSALSTSIGGRAAALGGSGIFTNDPTAFAETEFTGSHAVLGGITTNSSQSVYQDICVSVDGGTPDIFKIALMTDEPYSFAAKVIDGVSSGSHSVRISPMSGTPWTVLDYVGVLNTFGRGPLLIGHIPYVNNWTYAGFTLTAAIVDELNAEIDAVVAEFPYLPVEVVRTNDAFYSVDSCVSDGVHWSDSMHYRVFMLCKEKLSLWS